MIIDAHCHISREGFGGIEDYLETIKNANINKTVLVPGGMIDVRQMTKYVIGKAKPSCLTPPNEIIHELITKSPEQFYGYGVINPNEKVEIALKNLEDLNNKGFVGIKMSPIIYQFSLLGKVSKALADLCGQYKMPYYTHTLFQPSASTEAVGKLAKEFKDTTFIIGHMGFGPLDTDAIELASTLENVYLETSTANYLMIKEAVDKCGYEKVIYGSEYPLSDPIIEKQKIERLAISDEQKEYVFSKNILRILEK